MTDGTGNDPHFDPFADPFGAAVGQPANASAPGQGPSPAPTAPNDDDFDPEKTTRVTPSPTLSPPPTPEPAWDPERTTVVPSAPPPLQVPPPVYGAQPWSGAPTGGPPPPPLYTPPPMYTGSHVPPSAPRTNNRLIIAIIGAVVLVVVVVVVIAIAASGGSGSGSDDTPRAAAQGYLEALARGDAAAALDYGKDQPGSKDLLTDDVLKKQIAKMPITDIQILDDGSPIGDMAMVHVSARFGDQVSDARLTLHHGDGWKLDTATVKIDLSMMGSTNKALKEVTVFGKPADNPVYVFPGWVDYASGNANLEVTAKSPLLGDLNSYSNGYVGAGLEVKLSTAGNDAIMSALKSDLAKCTASNLLAPPGCPLKVQPYGLVDGTARWGSMGDLSDVKVLFNPYDMSATLIGSVKTNFTAQDTRGRLSDGSITGFISGEADVSTNPPTLTYR